MSRHLGSPGVALGRRQLAELVRTEERLKQLEALRLWGLGFQVCWCRLRAFGGRRGLGWGNALGLSLLRAHPAPAFP